MRRSRRLLQKLAQKATRGFPISSVLDQNVENEAILIDGAPKPMLPTADRDDDFVQVPLIAANGRTAPNAIGIFAAEFLGLLTDGFVADVDAARGKHFLDHPQTQRQSKIEPDCIADTLGGEAMTTIERITSWFHGPKLPQNPLSSVNLTVHLIVARRARVPQALMQPFRRGER